MAAISVVIVNHNTRELLRACLASLYRQGVDDLEVILIDNASTDGSVEMVRAEFPAARVTVNTENQGFAAPNNRGMEQAGGRFVLLLNTDTVLEDRSLRLLLECLDRNPEAGACGPRLLLPDGSTQQSVRGFPTLLTHLADMFFLDRLFPRSIFGRAERADFDYDRPAEVDHLMAAAFLVRREVLAEAGMFDERFVIYYNDMDWCRRIRARGWTIRYVPDARVLHLGGATTALVNRNFAYFRELHRNVELYYRKHFGRGSVLAYRLLLGAGFMMRTAGWGAVRLVRPSERSRHMFAFSWRTLLYAAGLPVPAAKAGEAG